MKIYLAGPMSGNGYHETAQSFRTKAEILGYAGYTVLHPMLGKDELSNERTLQPHGYDNPTCTNHAIFERDRWMVHMADIVFADLSGATSVSIGTMFELAWASQLGKHTVVVLPEGNPHEHAFVLEAADIIFRTTDEALTYLTELQKIS